MTSNFPWREPPGTLVRRSLYNLIFNFLSLFYSFYVLSHIKIRISVRNDFRVLVVHPAVERQVEKRMLWSKDNIKINFRQNSTSNSVCLL